MPEAAPQVVILAGGRATRLGPLALCTPKALLPIDGRPFLDYQLDWLQSQGVREVVILLGHLGEQIVAHVCHRADLDLHVRFHYDGGQLLGTGGASLGALSLLDSQFMLINGDTFLEFDLQLFWNTFTRGSFPAGLVVGDPGVLNAEHPNVAASHGYLELYDPSSADPRCSLSHLGVCAFQAKIVSKLRYASVADLGHLLDMATQSGPVLAWQIHSMTFDIGTPAGVDRFEHYFMNRLTQTQRKGLLVG